MSLLTCGISTVRVWKLSVTPRSPLRLFTLDLLILLNKMNFNVKKSIPLQYLYFISH